ncbi:hypothetical protein AO826_17025 [Xanthomonas phaseoli pv. manihotis]|nr:hypothetical protein AO826_17025 [Xanthomonas phaseoli pv. manihotis]
MHADAGQRPRKRAVRAVAVFCRAQQAGCLQK